MKKRLTLLLSVLIANGAVFANDFTDGSKAYDNDEYSVNGGISTNKYITRGEAYVLFLDTLKLDLKSNVAYTPFSDFQEISDEYKQYVIKSYELGLTSGRLKEEQLKFDFNESITKEEFLFFVGDYFNFYSLEESDVNDYGEIGEWSKGRINYFYKNGLILADKNGNLNLRNYIDEDEANLILFNVREYLTKNTISFGEVSRLIGSGSLGFSNDNFENSTFTKVTDITFYNDGNLLIVDSLSNKLRIANNSFVTDLVGSSSNVDLSGLPIGGYVDGSVEEALLNKPEKVLVTSDDLVLFTEKENNTIRMYDKKSNKVITLAGNKEAGYENGTIKQSKFNRPMGMAEDSLGNIYVADTLNHVIRKIDRRSGEVTLFAGIPNEYGNDLGELLLAKFNEPVDLFIDENDIIYIADSGNNAIKKIENGEVILVSGASTPISEYTQTEIGGDKDGHKLEALYSYPMGIYVDNGIIYVADTFNNKIKKIENNVCTTIAGTGEIGNELGETLQSTFNKPMDILVKDNTIYVADSNNQMIKVIDFK